MQIYIKAILIFCISIIIYGCMHKCQDTGNMNCDNYDPCAHQYATTADFIMEEDPGVLFEEVWKYYVTDTATAPFYIRFTANDSLCESYTWTIGAGTFTNRKFSLKFPASVIGQSIPIKLVVKRKPNIKCFPDDDGYDTVTRRIYFINPCVSMFNGSFFGYRNNDPKDTATVTIATCGTWYAPVYIDNLVDGFKIDTSIHSFCYIQDNVVGFKEVFMYSGGCSKTFPNARISCKIDKNNDMVDISFNYVNPKKTSEILEGSFKGYRKK